MNELIDFYKYQSVHPDGYTLGKMLNADDYWLAVKHNYIQWLFPLKKASANVPGSPIISQKEIDAFKTEKELKQGLMKSYKRMLAFYGFAISVDSMKRPIIIKANDFQERQKDWLSPNNHNYKRITRILESLSLLGQQEAADLFYRALKELYKEDSSQIGWTTFSYWKDAVGDTSK